MTATTLLSGVQAAGREDDLIKLEALRRFSEAVAASTMLEEILGTLLIHGMDALNAQRGTILRRGPAGVEVVVSREGGLIAWGAGPLVGTSLVDFVLESGQEYVQLNARAEAAPKGDGETSRVMICMPMESEPHDLLFYADRDGSHGGSFGQGAIWVLQSLVQFGRVSLGNARMIERVNEQNELLEALNRTSLLVSSSLDVDEILARLLDQIVRVTGAELALVLNIADDGVRVLGARGARSESPCYDLGVVTEVVTSAQALTASVPSAAPVESIMCVPLAIQNAPIGVLYVSASQTLRNFTAADLAMLQAMGAHAALAIHNARQFVLLQEKKNIETELAIAHTIQQSFFPKQIPSIAGLCVAGACEAAREVGGDYYDVIPLDNGQVALTLGDVSGKSIAASLYMAVVRTALRMSLRYGSSPRECLLEVNARIAADLKDGSFITCFLGIFDPVTARFSYASAGQHLAYMIGREGARPLCTRGLPLGLPPIDFGAALESAELELEPGDRIALVTDGIIEAQSETQEEFGEERLLEILTRAPARDTDALVRNVLGTVHAHMGAASPWDDMTLLVAEYWPDKSPASADSTTPWSVSRDSREEPTL